MPLAAVHLSAALLPTLLTLHPIPVTPMIKEAGEERWVENEEKKMGLKEKRGGKESVGMVMVWSFVACPFVRCVFHCSHEPLFHSALALASAHTHTHPEIYNVLFYE